MVLENEGLEVTGSARILAAKDRRATARASDLLAALLVSRSGMFESSSEVRAHMVRALCDEAVHYCFDPQTGATLIQVSLSLSLSLSFIWLTQNPALEDQVLHQPGARPPEHSALGRVARHLAPGPASEPAGLFGQAGHVLLVYLLARTPAPDRPALYDHRRTGTPHSSQAATPHAQDRRGHPGKLGSGSLVGSLGLIVWLNQDPEGTIPKGWLAALLAANEDEEEEEREQPPTANGPPPLAQASTQEEEEDF